MISNDKISHVGNLALEEDKSIKNISSFPFVYLVIDQKLL